MLREFPVLIRLERRPEPLSSFRLRRMLMSYCSFKRKVEFFFGFSIFDFPQISIWDFSILRGERLGRQYKVGRSTEIKSVLNVPYVTLTSISLWRLWSFNGEPDAETCHFIFLRGFDDIVDIEVDFMRKGKRMVVEILTIHNLANVLEVS